MKENLFQDWVQDILKNSTTIEKQIVITKTSINLEIINNLFSKQLCNLPLNEDKFRRMING